jgi:hypothetical protein
MGYTYTPPRLIHLLYKAVRVGAADITARLHSGEKKLLTTPNTLSLSHTFEASLAPLERNFDHMHMSLKPALTESSP